MWLLAVSECTELTKKCFVLTIGWLDKKNLYRCGENLVSDSSTPTSVGIFVKKFIFWKRDFFRRLFLVKSPRYTSAGKDVWKCDI